MAEVFTDGNVCGLATCQLVCPTNITNFQESFPCSSDATVTNNNVVKLRIMTGEYGKFIESTAKRYNEIQSKTNNHVEVEIVVVDFVDMIPNIINEATSKTGIFDGFISPPALLGSIVNQDGWMDLTNFIQDSTERTRDWQDILVSVRKWITTYQNRIYMYPLDGDVLHLFFRQDVLEHFNLDIPRTWDEYNIVAKTVHGKPFKNQTLIGSCIGRMQGCSSTFWTNLLLSSMTQTLGNQDGHLFDPIDMKPLLGEALYKTLEWMEEQLQYGSSNELNTCFESNDLIHNGTCVLTYNWGNTFNVHLRKGHIFANKAGGYQLGVARTPGSTHVLDRKTMKLVKCDSVRCKYGKYYEDIGWVNYSPYLAFGGWACAVNNFTTPGKKKLAMEFCAFAASREESTIQVIQNATNAPDGSDPFRTSHLNIEKWVENGFEYETTSNYITNIQESLTSSNCVTDIRFTSSADIMAVLDEEVFNHLSSAKNVDMPVSDEHRRRSYRQVGDRLTERWKEIIRTYDQQPTTMDSTLIQYQKFRNRYTENFMNNNQLGTGIRCYGWSITLLTLVGAMACGIWTYKHRATSVVRASQPLFLILISVGVFVFGASIIPMTIDDGKFTEAAAHKACMSLPWLISLGWSILFSALYAKIRRVNLVVHNAITFKQVRVSERDVMTPFALIFTANLILLIAWTAADPLSWKRIEISPTESYGTCSANRDSPLWKIMLTLLAVLNGAALIGANFEAWKARKIDTEYGESSYIGLIMASILQVVLVGVPLLFLVKENPPARFFVSSSMAFIISMSVLVLLFIPKVISLRTKKRRNTLNSGTKVSNTSLPKNDQMIDSMSVKTKVENLLELLYEAGIDGSMYVREAGLDDLAASAPRSFPDIASSLNLDSDAMEIESSRFESLPPVAEEDEDGSQEFTIPSESESDGPRFTKEQGGTTRTSITNWLDSKRNDVAANGSSSIVSTSENSSEEAAPTTTTTTMTPGNSSSTTQNPNASINARIVESMRNGF